METSYIIVDECTNLSEEDFNKLGATLDEIKNIKMKKEKRHLTPQQEIDEYEEKRLMRQERAEHFSQKPEEELIDNDDQ